MDYNPVPGPWVHVYLIQKGKIHINTHENKVPLYKYAQFSHMGQIPAVPERLMAFTDSKAKQCKKHPSTDKSQKHLTDETNTNQIKC